MPRKPIDQFWRERVKALVAIPPEGRRLTDKRIADILEEEAGSFDLRNPRRYDFPSERSVQRIRILFVGVSEAVRDYQRFRYPDSCTSGALPWESAAVAFELIREHRLDEAPPVRLVRWLWRVTLAIPDAPLHDRVRYAFELAARDAGLALQDVHERMATGRWQPWDTTKPLLTLTTEGTSRDKEDPWPEELWALFAAYLPPDDIDQREEPEQ